MLLVDKSISLTTLRKMAKNSFGNMVKAVIDINNEIMAVDAGLHADEEAFLLNYGSKQTDLWGVNIYPNLSGVDLIEFDSMINLRPTYGNMTRSVEDEKIQKKIIYIVQKLIK